MGMKKERRQVAFAAVDLPDECVDSDELVDGGIDAAHLASSSVSTAKIADDAVTNAKLGPTVLKYLQFKYDFAKLAGAQGAKTLTSAGDAAQTIPDNAVIVRAYLEAVTSLASSGSATVKLGITGDDDCFIGATDFDNAAYVAGAATELTAGIPLKTTAAVSVLATIATADLTTSGKFYVWVEYFEGA